MSLANETSDIVMCYAEVWVIIALFMQLQTLSRCS